MTNTTTVLNPGFFAGETEHHIGTETTVCGMTGTIEIVEPFSDWAWSVEIRVGTERVTVVLPTDFRTDDNLPANDAARAMIAAWDAEREDAADERMHRMESMACDM